MNIPKQNLREVDAFIKDVSKIKYFKPDGKPLSYWKVFRGKKIAQIAIEDLEHLQKKSRFAARDIEYNDSRMTHKDKLWNKTQVTAQAIISKTGRDKIIRNSASNIAWDKLRKMKISKPIAEDASDDVELMQSVLLVRDKINPEYLNYARKRMKVWQKGYGLLADVYGTFYVYSSASATSKKEWWE